MSRPSEPALFPPVCVEAAGEPRGSSSSSSGITTPGACLLSNPSADRTTRPEEPSLIPAFEISNLTAAIEQLRIVDAGAAVRRQL